MTSKVLTSFDIAAETYELKNRITDSRVNNIYQLDTKTIVLKLHKVNRPPLLLVLEAGRRFHLTAYAQEKPTTPPAFCMALRKYLRDSWLRRLEQHEFERIVIFTFETKIGMMSLILELFGEGNILLTNAEGKILQALIFKRMRDRNVLRGETYSFPPASGRNPLVSTLEELAKDLKDSGDTEVVRALARTLGVGGVYAEEILLRAGVEKDRLCKELTAVEVSAIFQGLQSLVGNITKSEFQPQIIVGEDGVFLDVVPFQLKRYESSKFQEFSDFNEALDAFYLKVTAAEKAADLGDKLMELEREADKLRRIVTEQEKTLQQAEARAEQERRIGDMIYAYAAEIHELFHEFEVARAVGKDLRKVGSEILAAQNPKFRNNLRAEKYDAHNLAIDFRSDDTCFSISLRKSIFENAAEFYDRGKKDKQKASGALAALDESRRRLSDVEKRIRDTQTAQLTKPAEIMEEITKHRIRGKEWYEKFRWFTSSDGSLVVAGKDAVSNEVLIKKHTEDDDIVFHAEITGAPFVVVKTKGKTPTEATLVEAGEYAAAFSRAWREGLGSVDIYWVRPDQLSKTGPSGEYVTRGAFAVVGKRNWMRGMLLRIAVGVVSDGEPSFLGGPVETVRAKTKNYVTLVPGDDRGKDLLKRVLAILAYELPKEHRETVRKASIEQIRELVPYTCGRIIGY